MDLGTLLRNHQFTININHLSSFSSFREGNEVCFDKQYFGYFKVTVVVVFIALGWGFMDGANHTPFIPVNEGVEALMNSGKMTF
jgi:APA family basic amino acid/polyamine antiporter